MVHRIKIAKVNEADASVKQSVTPDGAARVAHASEFNCSSVPFGSSQGSASGKPVVGASLIYNMDVNTIGVALGLVASGLKAIAKMLRKVLFLGCGSWGGSVGWLPLLAHAAPSNPSHSNPRMCIRNKVAVRGTSGAGVVPQLAIESLPFAVQKHPALEYG